MKTCEGSDIKYPRTAHHKKTIQDCWLRLMLFRRRLACSPRASNYFAFGMLCARSSIPAAITSVRDFDYTLYATLYEYHVLGER
jgi:hypothetical protein